MTRKNVLILLNFQWNYFSSNGSAYLGPKAKDLKIRIVEFVNTLDRRAWSVVQSKDIRSPEDDFYAHQKTQCTVGSKDIIMLDGITFPGILVVPATRPSAVYKTQLLNEIKKHNTEEIAIIGTETHAAVLFTASDLKLAGYKVTVVEPLTMSRDDYLHNSAISVLSDTVGVKISDRL
jgi:nicotinamidase-related amidase